MLRMIKKKLYYDYKITEQEIYILTMIRTMEYRQEIMEKKSETDKKLIEAKEKLSHILKLKEIFLKSKNRFVINYIENQTDKLKINQKTIENIEKTLFENVDLSNFLLIFSAQTEKEYLHLIRNDPYYFYEKDNIKQIKKYGNKPYKEITKTVKGLENDINNINYRYYYVRIFLLIIFRTNSNMNNSKII